MGGICTHQLADFVLMFVGANRQNLDGTLKMATSLSQKDLIESGRKGRKLSLIPIPSRIDSFEAESLDEFARLFKTTLGQFFPEGLNRDANLFTELKIPYLPYYAYQERVAVRETYRDSAIDLVQAFERITVVLTALLPENSCLNQKMSSLLSFSEDVRYQITGAHVFGKGFGIESELSNVSGVKKTLARSPCTILFINANPKKNGLLKLDQKFRDIKEELQRAQQLDRFNCYQRRVVRPRDIQRAILDVNPQIIHFSGHGQNENRLVLEDEAGNSKSVNDIALAGLFRLFSDQVQCVVLDACYSEVQAHAINQYIPYVIGIDKEIGDSAAATFAIGFYDALGAGLDMEFAFKLGCAAIQIEGLAGHLTPELLKKPITNVAISSRTDHPRYRSRNTKLT